MARYRKVDIRVWSDERFRALSPLQPCGQALWLVLMTGPQTGVIPGLAGVGEAAFAELLGWSLEAFREAFREANAQGMVEADWKARLLWVPNAIRYNRPESPNVVKSWCDAWDELPECALKVKAWHALKAFLEGIGEPFAQAFLKACPKPSSKAMPNQEQEQEQEQEKRSPANPKQRDCRDAIAQAFEAVYTQRTGAGKFPWTGKERSHVGNIATACEDDPAIAREVLRAALADSFLKANFIPSRVSGQVAVLRQRIGARAAAALHCARCRRTGHVLRDCPEPEPEPLSAEQLEQPDAEPHRDEPEATRLRSRVPGV